MQKGIFMTFKRWPHRGAQRTQQLARDSVMEPTQFANSDLCDAHCIVGQSRPMPFPKGAQCGQTMLADRNEIDR
jgi:hypothetical protein